MTFGLASLLNKQDTIKANVLHSIGEQNLSKVASPYSPGNLPHHPYRPYKYKELTPHKGGISTMVIYLTR
jgi:hypothetical protein